MQKRTPIDHGEVRAISTAASTVKTNAENYGSRLDTELGQKMLRLEFQLSQTTKKKKLSPEMICY